MTSASFTIALISLVVAVLSFTGTLTLSILGYLHTMKPKVRARLQPVVRSEEDGGGIAALVIHITNVRPVPVTVHRPMFILPGGVRLVVSHNIADDAIGDIELRHGQSTEIWFPYRAVYEAYVEHAGTPDVAIEAEILTNHGVRFRTDRFQTSELPPPPPSLDQPGPTDSTSA